MLIRIVAALTLVAAFIVATPAPAEVPTTVATRPARTAATVPTLAVVPGTFVFRVPGGDADVLVYAGRYYRFRDGAWYAGEDDEGPWNVIPVDRVPRSLLALSAVFRKTADVPVAPVEPQVVHFHEIGVLTHP